jgi:hypothetical protein
MAFVTLLSLRTDLVYLVVGRLNNGDGGGQQWRSMTEGQMAWRGGAKLGGGQSPPSRVLRRRPLLAIEGGRRGADQRWKDYLITFLCTYITSRMESKCDLGVHFNMNVTISQYPQSTNMISTMPVTTVKNSSNRRTDVSNVHYYYFRNCWHQRCSCLLSLQRRAKMYLWLKWFTLLLLVCDFFIVYGDF